MAVPTVTLLNHTLLSAADTATGWFDTVTLDTDIKVEGSGSMSGTLRADNEISYYDSTTAPITAAGKTVRGWFNTTNVPYLEIKANGGLQLEAFDGTNTQVKNIAGIDTYSGGWLNYIWDMDDFTTLTLANVRRWGVRQQLTLAAKNVVNAWHDAIRYLDGYSLTGGTSGDKVRLPDIALYDKGTTTLRGYGVVMDVNGVYFCTGKVQFGTGATAHWFEMDGQILVFTEQMVKAGLYSLVGIGSGTNILIKNSVLKSTGASDNTRFSMDFSEANLASMVMTDNVITRASTIVYKAGQTVTGNSFDNCGVITHGGANMSGCTVKGYAGATGSASLLYNVNADPAGELDDMTFVKGTAAASAIELGPNTPSTITLSGWTVSGYNAADGQNDSVIYNNSGKAITVNVTGNSGAITYRNGTGASTVIAADQRTLTINVRDSEGALVTDATEITLVRTSDLTVLHTEENVTDGSTSYTYSYGSDVACYVNVVSSGLYVPKTVDPVTLINADQTVDVYLDTDRIYSNP